MSQFEGVAEITISARMLVRVSGEGENPEQAVLDDINEGNFNYFDWDVRRFIKNFLATDLEAEFIETDSTVHRIDAEHVSEE